VTRRTNVADLRNRSLSITPDGKSKLQTIESELEAAS
jgi:DNA-binding MarR family transcriptional regulator